MTETLLSNFSGARSFSFLNEGRFSTLSPQSAAVFTKIGCELGKFRARGVEDVPYFQKLPFINRLRNFRLFSPFGKYLGGAPFTGFSFRQCLNMKGPANTSSIRNSLETLAGFDSL